MNLDMNHDDPRSIGGQIPEYNSAENGGSFNVPVSSGDSPAPDSGSAGSPAERWTRAEVPAAPAAGTDSAPETGNDSAPEVRSADAEPWTGAAPDSFRSEAPAAEPDAPRGEETPAQPVSEGGAEAGPSPTGPQANPWTNAAPTGEYRYIPERRSTYSDAGYVPASDAGAMPRHYHSSAQAERKPEKKAPKQHKGGKAAGWIAACLACAIIGGAAGGYAVPKLTERFGGAAVSASVTESAGTRDSGAASEGTVISVAAPAESPQITTTIVNSGKELTGTEIYYNLAVNQVVGITTEITYTNVWGYSTSGAVKGSGFILSPDGYIMTNYHVIEDALKGGYDIEVLTYDGTKYIATVVGGSEDNDVAVLKIDAQDLNAVTIGDSDSLKVGEQVYAVGNPLGELEYTMTGGMISATDREITTTENGRATTINMFQIDAAINSGNSGGPVYNSRGEVVGIASAKYASSGVEGLAFAIPINDAYKLAQEIITTGHVTGPVYIGILRPSTLDASSAQYYGIVPGVYFEGIEEGSAAEKAGLKVGDIIVGLGDKEIATVQDLTDAKKDFAVGDTTTVRVFRGGEYVNLTITFDKEMIEIVGQQDSGSSQNSGQGSGQQGGATNPYGYFYDFLNPFGR